MKRLLSIVLACSLMIGCVNNPYVKIVSADGTTTIISTGRNLGSEVDEQVSEVEGNGYHVRHMVKRQDATRVLISAIRTAGTLGVAGLTYLSSLEQQVTDRILAGEITKREGQTLLAEIARAKVAAGVTTATTLNPNVIPK